MSAWTWDAGRPAIRQKISLAAQGRQEVERSESSTGKPAQAGHFDHCCRPATVDCESRATSIAFLSTGSFAIAAEGSSPTLAAT